MSLPTKQEALKDFFAAWTPRQEEELVPLDEVVGRITMRELYSNNTLPVYRVSMCDGVAVSSTDFSECMPDTTGWKEGREFMRADTGDDFSDKYDAVIRIENVNIGNDGSLTILSGTEVVAGNNVKKRGSMLNEGDVLINANTSIRPTDLAVLAMGGITMVPVRCRPKVAFIPTGSELIPAGNSPKRGENVDTNSIMVKYLLEEMGAEPIIFPIITDSPVDLKKVLYEALSCTDVVLINGGSSKGEEDFNTRLLASEGQLLHHGIAAAPGFPMALSVVKEKPVVNIPGPTIATFYGTEWCVRAIVARYLNIHTNHNKTVLAMLDNNLNCPEAMDFLCRMNAYKGDDGKYMVQPLPLNKFSLASCMASNAMFISPIGSGILKKGDMIEVQLLRGEEYINQ